MTTINPVTNLPEVPDDFYWKVEERRPSFSIFDHNPGGVYVCLVERKQRKKVKFDKNGKAKKSKKFHTVDIEVAGRLITRTETVVKPLFKVDPETDEHTEIGVREVEEHVAIPKAELTGEIIQEHAALVFEAWESRQKGNEFLGSYPPKQLEVN